MDQLIEAQWTQGLAALTGTELGIKKPRGAKSHFADQLAMSTSVFIREMDPGSDAEPEARRVKGSLNVLLRKGLGRWAGDWILDTFRKDALKKLVPLLDALQKQYQDYISAESNKIDAAEWVIPAFHNVIDAIHSRLKVSGQLAHLFDEQLRAFDQEPALEVSSRFLAEFSAELAIRLPPSFDDVAHLYFETIFKQYEVSHPMTAIHRTHQHGHHSAHEASWEALLGNGRQSGSTDPGKQQDQQLSKKRRRVMQDGRFAMDLFVDDKDDELVEQLFHGSHGPGGEGVEALEKESQMQSYLDLCHKLEETGFAFHMTQVVTRMLYSKVESKIFTLFRRRWTMATLESGKEWMSFVVLPFLRLTLLPKKDREDPTGRKRFKMWASRLEFYFFKTFGDLRIEEFFDIIVECPESAPSVLDLKACIEWTGQREQLKEAILVAMEKRLLHPGAETKDIIEFYICTIKYLRILDPSGVMLDHTARAINQYLRTRDDTMRAIVSCIVDDSSDLLNNSTEGIQVGGEVDDDGSDNETWVPEPVNAGPDLSSARRRMADIISVLANIYDTNDRFIEEFQTNLADRLLQATDFGIEREVRQLELLKLRFGEADLHHCEVMLADVAESKRVNANIQSLRPDINVSATIASRYYWPVIEDEPLELPGPLKRSLEQYSAVFEVSKPAQKLSIFSSLGMVDVELELEDRTIEMQVEPMHAAIIYLFEDQDMWTLAAISAKLQVSEESLEQKMQLWIREGVLKEIGRFQYQLIENASSSST
ncbi:Anaphase-promoting complex subunit 2 [Mortierella alpina]|uniref:Anaphase-promoting complex subunit 2 n=1 Tax=Mortierella alpina TaxID=64518 RepID=A0A9P6J3Q2_MORAP|nr:Anaphase-promoting complex subunit 2 [Mortierella alpina]